MAFTQASVQAEMVADGLGCIINFYQVGATVTDIGVQNLNTTSSRKTGMTQVLNSRSAAQAYSDIKANLTA